MNHKPMLAVDCGGLDKLVFPLVISPKLDGVRAIISRDGVLARSLKHIPNVHVQNLLRGLPVGLDGELLAGDPCAPDVYRKTVSMVMADDRPIVGLVYHVFDFQAELPFRARYQWLKTLFLGLGLENRGGVALVEQVDVANREALATLEDAWVNRGYEGVILRKPDGPYKHGRSTVKEGFLLKLKHFADAEAVVIGVTEMMHNGNEAKTNALGHTERSHRHAGLMGGKTLGTLIVRDVKTGVEFEIGTGFTAAERADYWAHSGRLTGRLAKYKHFPIGAKDKPRHPVFLGWRDKRDV